MRCGLDCVSLGQLLGREWGGSGGAGSGRCRAALAGMRGRPPGPLPPRQCCSRARRWGPGSFLGPASESPGEGRSPVPWDWLPERSGSCKPWPSSFLPSFLPAPPP